MRKSLAVVAAALLSLASGCASGEGSGKSANAAAGDELRLDYAYYNPLSLVIKDQGLLERELGPKGIKIKWVFSGGSNKANESLRAGAIDIGSTAGAAALLARANGTPIKSIAVYRGGEWTALVVPKTSKIASLRDLKGRKVAATKGTDPYFFLLQSLKSAGLSGKDVQIVNLQHPDGKTALERGQVDAWAGLDPYMAQTQLEAGSKLVYRNVGFNSYGLLNAREDFLAERPELAQTVVNAYEQARKWALRHPDDLASLLAREAKISESVARIELKRTGLDLDPVPGDAQRQVFERILPIIVADGDVRSGEAARSAVGSLYDTRFAAQRTTP